MTTVCEVRANGTPCGEPAVVTLSLRAEPVGKGDTVFTEVVRALCEAHAEAARRVFGSPVAVDVLLAAGR